MFSRIPDWFRKITNRRKANHASRPVTRRAFLSLERLEDRAVPTIIYYTQPLSTLTSPASSTLILQPQNILPPMPTGAPTVLLPASMPPPPTGPI